MKHCGFLWKMMLVLAVLPILGLVQSNPALARVYTIYPEADSYINSQNPDSNYGTDNQLYAYYFPDYMGAPLTERSYLKFDLSGLPKGATLKAAKLYLYVNTNYGHPPAIADLYHVEDGWTALGITWNNQPPTGSYLASQGFMFWGQYYSWNLFESGLWNPSQDLSDQKLSLMVKLPAEGQPGEVIGYSFTSSKHATFKPYLEVTVNSDPAAINLLLLDN